VSLQRINRAIKQLGCDKIIEPADDYRIACFAGTQITFYVFYHF
jgi:hypothetical protein